MLGGSLHRNEAQALLTIVLGRTETDWAWEPRPLILAFRRQRQKDLFCEFQGIWGYTVRSCLEKKKKKAETNWEGMKL